MSVAEMTHEAGIETETTEVTEVKDVDPYELILGFLDSREANFVAQKKVGDTYRAYLDAKKEYEAATKAFKEKESSVKDAMNTACIDSIKIDRNYETYVIALVDSGYETIGERIYVFTPGFASNLTPPPTKEDTP